MPELIPKTLEEVIQSNKPVLVDFFAEWCGPCKMMPPILKSVKDSLKDEVTIIKIDVDKNPGLAQKLQIQGVPTFILYKNGKMLWRQSGMQSLTQLQQLIEQAK